jgi:Domain of unknown function (DUF5664)
MAQGCVDKRDSGKAPMSLLAAVYRPLQEVARVLEFGNRKYKSIRNFRHVPNGEQRYLDAALRHILSRADGERLDSESGIDHLAHATCCTLMALWFATQEES